MPVNTKWYGVVAAENKDSSGETVDIEGMQDSLMYVRDEHKKNEDMDPTKAIDIIGAILDSKKIFSEKDCENGKQLLCWNEVKVPFLYAEGEFFDGGDQPHPDAAAAAAILKFCHQNRDRVRFLPGYSVDGVTLERSDEQGRISKNGKRIKKSIAISAAWTLKPMNHLLAGKIYIEDILQKSSNSIIYSDKEYNQAVFDEKFNKSSSIEFNNIYSINHLLKYKLEKLHKSLEDYEKAHTTLKCQFCNQGYRLFKSMDSIASLCLCKKCGNPFTMLQVWSFLNR